MEKLFCPVCGEQLGSKEVEGEKFKLKLLDFDEASQSCKCRTCSTIFNLKAGIEKGLIVVFQY
jgi:hypothetical protein